MGRKQRIFRRIRRFVRAHSLLWQDYENWYVGITQDIQRRKRSHERRLGKELVVHASWRARSAREAADIERLFLDQGMQGSGGGWNERSVHVYVFKVRGPYS